MTFSVVSNILFQVKTNSFKKRFKYALNGIVSTAKGEPSFGFQIVAGIGAIAILIYLKAEPTWWALFSISIGSVLSAELLNTSLEHLMDLLHPERHPSVMLVKDCAAGAVLILSIISVMVLICFLFEKVG